VALRLAAALFAGLVYVNALHNPFIYDDFTTVVTNASIVPPLSLRGVVLHDVKRPVVNISYAIDRTLWGARPAGFHATNVVMHMVNVLLLFAVAAALSAPSAARAERSRRLAPFMAAMLLAVHPMMTEAVGYVSGRSELLCTAFVLASLLCGLRWIGDERPRWAMLTVLFWVGGMLSKETAAVLPVLLLAADWLSAADRRALRHRVLAFHAPLIAIAALAGIARLVVLIQVERSAPTLIQLPVALIALDVVVQYFRLLLLPTHQTLFHAVTRVAGVVDPRAIVAILTVGVLITAGWKLRRRDRMAAFGLIAFLLLLAPGSVLTALNVGEPMAEHRVYAASCGLFLAIGSGVAWLVDRAAARVRRPMLWVGPVLTAILLSFAAETMLRNAIWSDPVAVWRESVALSPSHPRPRMLLGEALEDGGRRSEALEQYQAAVRLQPGDATAQLKLGLCLAALGRFDEARRALEESTRLDPGNEPARRALQLLGQIRPAAS
jgi:protein O-mannosyl-transferase